MSRTDSFWILRLALFCCVALLLLPACKRVPSVIRNTVPGASGESKLEVQVRIAPDANKNNPVALDLVLVSDKKLLEEISKVTAKDWFEGKRAEFRNDNPKETVLDIKGWEWVPGQAVRLDRFTIKLEVVGGVVFANYLTPGAHRATIDPRKSVQINLDSEKFTVKTLKK